MKYGVRLWKTVSYSLDIVVEAETPKAAVSEATTTARSAPITAWTQVTGEEIEAENAVEVEG